MSIFMENPLSMPSVSDADAINAVKSLAYIPEHRKALWSARYTRSAGLQAEFGDERFYLAYMESAVSGRARILVPSDHNATNVQSDQRSRALVRSAGWSKEQRVQNWTNFYNDCAAVKTEFASAENYTTYMEGEFSRGR